MGTLCLSQKEYQVGVGVLGALFLSRGSYFVAFRLPGSGALQDGLCVVAAQDKEPMPKPETPKPKTETLQANASPPPTGSGAHAGGDG